jgi:Family of unknown function (DUF5990)
MTPAKTKAAELQVQVRVRCTELPGASFADPYTPGTEHMGAVFVGVQRGTEAIEEVRADAREVRFELDFRVGERKGGAPNFLGPFAQGPVDDRFFYLTWGVGAAPGRTRMFRRLKVRLGQLTWAQIRSATKSGEPLRVTLRLTDAKGGPLCGSAKPPFVAWEAG